MKLDTRMLRSVSFVALMLLTACGGGSGTVDPDPATLRDLPGAPKELDLNGDDVADIGIGFTVISTDDVPTSAMTHVLLVDPKNGSRVLRPSEPVERGSEIGSSVDASQQWATGATEIATLDYTIDEGWDDRWSGPWSGAMLMYLPIELQLEAKTHYGWIQMSVDKERGTLDIHDTSFNPVPFEPIPAGAKLALGY